MVCNQFSLHLLSLPPPLLMFYRADFVLYSTVYMYIPFCPFFPWLTINFQSFSNCTSLNQLPFYPLRSQVCSISELVPVSTNSTTLSPSLPVTMLLLNTGNVFLHSSMFVLLAKPCYSISLPPSLPDPQARSLSSMRSAPVCRETVASKGAKHNTPSLLEYLSPLPCPPFPGWLAA